MIRPHYAVTLLIWPETHRNLYRVQLHLIKLAAVPQRGGNGC